MRSITTQRPLGIWFFTVYAFLFYGLLPLVGRITLRLSPHQIVATTITPYDIFTSILQIGTVISAIGVFRGRGHTIWQVGLTTLVVGLSVLSLVTLLQKTLSPSSVFSLPSTQRQFQDLKIVGAFRLVWSAINFLGFPALLVWYFKKSSAKATAVSSLPSHQESINNQLVYVLFIGVMAALFYGFLNLLPFQPNVGDPMWIATPKSFFILLLSAYTHPNAEVLVAAASDVLSVLSWFAVGIVIGKMAKRIEIAVLILLTLETISIILSFWLIGRMLAGFPPV